MTIRRRSVVSWVACGALALPPSRAARAARPRTVGLLVPSTMAKERVTLAPFFERMTELGWLEPSTVRYVWRAANDEMEALSRLAYELVAQGPEVIYAPPAPAATAARHATATIPIVFATGTDPVGTGLVASLARPGGNVTGAISVAESLAPKLVQLLLQVKPSIRTIGLVGAPGDPRWKADQEALAAVAPALGVAVLVEAANDARQLEAAVDQLARRGVDALLTDSTITFNLRDRLMALAMGRRLPVAGHRTELTEAGALLSYSAPLWRQIRRSADIVDKVLRGQAPAEIPIEQPTQFELVLNRRAARALNLSFPAALLTSADRVID